MVKKNEILTSFQRDVLTQFSKTRLNDFFYFTGGTCLSACYFQHRFSEDLDFFSKDLVPDEIILGEIKKIKENLQISEVKHIKHLNRMQFFFFHKDAGVKMECVYFPFLNIAKPRLWKEFQIKINSLIDLAVDKIFTAYERDDPKDIYDLYYLFQKGHYRLHELLSHVKNKFGVDIDPVILQSKIEKNCNLLEKIAPLIIKKEDKLVQRILNIFQKTSNTYLNTLLL